MRSTAATSANGSQYPDTIRWSTPVDLAPQYSGGDLFIHYGSPHDHQPETSSSSR